MNLNASIDIGDNVTKLLTELAGKIGTTADKVFPWYVKQAVIEGWTFIFAISFVLFIGTALIVLSWRKATFDHNNGPNRYGVFLIIGIVFVSLAFIIGVLASTWAAGNILNPEYAAMSTLLGQLQTVGK